MLAPSVATGNDSDTGSKKADSEDFTPTMQLEKSRKLAHRACKDLCCFMSFLTVFTVVQVVGQSTDTSLFSQHISASFTPLLDQVVDDKTWYRYMRKTFLPKAFFFEAPREHPEPDASIFADSTDNAIDRWFLSTPQGEAFPTPSPHLLVAMDLSNHMLGAVRARQYRVTAAENCISGSLFAHFSTTCYRAFSANTAETGYATADSGAANGEAGTAAVKSTEPEIYGIPGESPPFSGSIASYTGTAFYTDFTSLQEALAELQAMEERKYIDTGTRVILLDFTVYNSNIDQFALTRISFEYGPSGIVRPAIRISVLRRDSFGPFVFDTTKGAIASVGDILIVVFLIYYVTEELSELSVSRWAYLDEGWNYVDWANMILLSLAYAYRLKVYLSFANVEVGAEQIADRTTFTDYQTEAEDVATVRMLNSFNSLLLWIKFVKYIEFMPYVQFLYVSVNTIMDKYFSFLFLFIVLMCGFVHAFTIGFGSLLSNMVSFDSTAVSLLRSFLGDVDFLPVYREAPVFGAILILAFYVSVMLVSINVFFAIIASGISENKSNFANMVEDVRHLAMRDAAQLVRNGVVKVANRILREIPYLSRILKPNKKIAPTSPTTAALANLPRGGKETAGALGDKSARRRKSSASSRRSSSDAGSRSGYKSTFRESRITDFSTKDLCNAADQMAGRLLMRIETASVEIKVEILRMKDSVLEMVNVTSVLGDRLSQIQEEQEDFLGQETT